MTHVDELYAILESTPDDWDTRRVLADAMEEVGDVVGAAGQRWQVKFGRRPVNVKSEFGVEHWWISQDRKVSAAALPKGFLEESHFKKFKSSKEAERWLAERLHRMKEEK